jgi:uncharacterized protein YbjT (DUF2867 family)
MYWGWEMILVTGAAGKTGRAIIRALVGRGQSVRALVRRPEDILAVEQRGAQDAVVGDMRDADAFRQAAQGTKAIYHICPNVSPDEMTIGQAAITAARAAGVERFVYHSVLHPQIEAMPHHWLKLRVEERLLESTLPFTILQPAAYMQNVLAHWEQIATRGIYPAPYAFEARLGMVDLVDVAEAAAVVLAGSGHLGATYELVGPEALSQTEVAAILSRQLSRPVRAEVIPLDAWERNAQASGMDEYQVATLLKMFRYYDQHGFWGNPNVLSWLLDRPATRFEAFVARTVRGEDAV